MGRIISYRDYLDFLRNGAQNIIGKPFESELLLRTVRETLDTATRAKR